MTAPITNRILVLYSLPQIPHSLALLPVVNFIPAYYSDNLGLPIAMVGLMLMLTRLTDVITDPFVGIASDRARTPIGRRRPFILVGLPILCIAAWLLFVPPEDARLGWLFACLFAMYLGFTLVDLPYASWGADLSNDYDERSKITGWRGAFGAIGTLAALSIPLVLQLLGRPGTGEMLFWIAVFFVVCQPLAFAIMLIVVKEPKPEIINRQHPSFWQGLRLVFRNASFVRLLAAVSLATAGMVIGATLNLLVLTHMIKAEDAFPPIIFLQNIALLLGIPFWGLLAQRFEKHSILAFCSLMVAGCLAATIFFGEGQAVGFGACLVLLGFALGGVIFLPPSMVADIVDQDIVETGQERTATFFAFLGMGTKMAVAIGVLVGTAVPAAIGFQPSDANHAPEVLENLSLVYAFSGLPFLLFAALLVWRYPLSRAVQEELRHRISSADVQ